MSKLACLMPISLLLTAVPALAQTPTPPSGACLPFEPDNTIVWPATGYGSAADFRRLVLADFTGDQAAEGVVLAGGLAVMLDTIEVHDIPRKIVFPSPPQPDSVADIATLHGAGPLTSDDAPTDGVLMTDARGLFLVTYSDLAFQAPIVIGNTEWVSAAPIHVDYLNNDVYEDVIGVSLNHRSILRLHRNPPAIPLDPPPLAFTPQPPLTLNYDILDVVAVDWNKSADGEREIVALTRRGLYVFGKNVTTGQFELQQTVIYLALTGCITRFDVAGGERLAWTRKTSAGPSELLVLSKGPDENNPVDQHGPWTLTLDMCGQTLSIEPLALLAGNYDLTANEDLLVVHEANRTALMLRNVGAPDYFDPSDDEAHDVIALGNAPLGSSNVGVPAFEPLDGDGADDVVFPVGTSSKIQVFLGLPFYRAMAISTQPANSATVIVNETLYGDGLLGERDSLLHFVFDVPPSLTNYTHIDMIIWGEHDGYAVEENALYHVIHPLDGPHGRQSIDIGRMGTEILPLPIPFPDGTCWGVDATKKYFYTQFRFVVPGTSTHSRIFAGGFTMENCPASTNTYSHLLAEGIPGAMFELRSFYTDDLVEDPEDPLPFMQRTLLGAFAPMTKVPYFADGAVPNPGSAVPGVSAQAVEQ